MELLATNLASKSLLTARKADVQASKSVDLIPIMRPIWNHKRFTCLSEPWIGSKSIQALRGMSKQQPQKACDLERVGFACARLVCEEVGGCQPGAHDAHPPRGSDLRREHFIRSLLWDLSTCGEWTGRSAVLRVSGNSDSERSFRRLAFAQSKQHKSVPPRSCQRGHLRHGSCLFG
jgi:hypothetical protein